MKKGLLKTHTTSLAEIRELRHVVERELKDADVAALSNDRRFACSYNAALQLGHMVIAASGHRTNPVKPGHHKLTFEVAEDLIGTEAASLTAFFDICRKKRNNLDYHTSGAISDGDVAQIQKQARDYQVLVENWIASNHQGLA